jgi:hypothetical protein
MHSVVATRCTQIPRMRRRHGKPTGAQQGVRTIPSPKSECQCSCNGTLHGILTGMRPEYIPGTWEVPEFRQKRPRKKKGRRVAAVAAVVTVTGTVGGLTATGTFSTPSGGSGGLSVQANVDLKTAISGLSGLGFGGKLISNAGTSGTSQPTTCAENATGQVKQFLTHYPCEQYSAETWTITRQGSTTNVVFAWVTMPTTPLAGRYKAIVDTYGTGNPPGVSSAFNGLCYASGQQDSTVWTVEVHPTGNPNADRTILQAAAPQKLSAPYVAKHCVT